MKALGVGWTMQDTMYNDGDQVVKEGPDRAAHAAGDDREKDRYCR